MQVLFCPKNNFYSLSQEHLGDLLLSVMYQPTNNRIVVVVMKAAKLKKMDLIGSCGKKMILNIVLSRKYSLSLHGRVLAPRRPFHPNPLDIQMVCMSIPIYPSPSPPWLVIVSDLSLRRRTNFKAQTSPCLTICMAGFLV